LETKDISTTDNNIENRWRWEEGFVDTAREHIKLFFGEYGLKMAMVALVAPPRDKCFNVQFLTAEEVNDSQSTQIIENVRKELDFYLVEKGELDPWKYAIYHTHTGADMYSKVHWGYFPDGSRKVEINLSRKARDLLLRIAKCESFLNFNGQPIKEDPCSSVLLSQCKLGLADPERYLPIPWQGHIETAKILFISSNPSVLGRVGYEVSYGPKASWLKDNSVDDKIVDFYECRFDDDREWVRNDIYYRCTPQYPLNFSKNWVRYWASVRRLADEILNKDISELFAPGIDYALTEIVHCQANREDGVRKARKICAEKYLDSILDVADKAKIIVLLGTQAVDTFNERYNLNLKAFAGMNQDKEYVGVGEMCLGNIERLIVALPHPDSRGKRKLEDCLTPEEIRKIGACFTCD